MLYNPLDSSYLGSDKAGGGNMNLSQLISQFRPAYRLAALLALLLAGLALHPSHALAQGSPPGAPRFVVAAVGNGFLQVGWMVVTGATKYDVEYSSDGGSSWTSAASNLGASAVFAEQYRINGTSNSSA